MHKFLIIGLLSNACLNYKDEEDIAEEMRYSDEYLEILRLKRLRREKLRVFDQTGRQALAKHIGFEVRLHVQ